MKNRLRQFLRLIAVTSVRNSLETRYSSCEIESECQKPISKLLQTMCNINSAVIDLHLLLQDQDVNRLRQTVYRDLDDQKNSEFLALASVYLGTFSKNTLIHFRFDTLFVLKSCSQKFLLHFFMDEVLIHFANVSI